jgi:cell division protein FtsQ
VRSVAEDFDNESMADAVRANATRRIVLPRFLRRPVRVLRRLDWRLPPRIGLKSLAALFLATAVAGVVSGGHGTAVVSAVTAWSGFAIENVKITGQSETSEVDVLDSLQLGSFPSLLTFDVEAAKARVESLPWVAQATLRKLFPDTLEIAVVEREPYALWQHGGALSLIDDTGKVIADAFSDRYAALPRVVGPLAAEKATAYAALIESFPSIARRTRAGVLVSGERWTLVLDNGMQLMLPAAEPEKALAAIAELDRDHAVLSREIAALDFRLPDRMTVRLTDEGLAARKLLLKERDRTASRGRTNT